MRPVHEAQNGRKARGAALCALASVPSKGPSGIFGPLARRFVSASAIVTASPHA